MWERGESTALSSWCAQAGVNINASESGVRISPGSRIFFKGGSTKIVIKVDQNVYF